jgi:hypothetical protein
LKAAYAEEGFYVGADQVGSFGFSEEQGRSYRRHCCFAAVSERTLFLLYNQEQTLSMVC